MTKANFADKYRPQTFDAVFGQESAVTCLSQLIKRGRVGRNVLLHGSVGSGKTTLAWIYARALNCVAPDPDGSPCRDRCDPCRSASEGQIAGFHEYNVSKHGGEVDPVVEWVRACNYDERVFNFRILFFDEAQALKPRACDALLDHVERPANRVLFFFATTEVERIRPALRSRLFDLVIRPLPALDAVAFLRRYAEAERLDCEPGALELLAGLRNGYPRDLLLGLDRVYDRDSARLTINQVRAAFDVDQTEVLVAYFEALADGDLGRQTELAFGWREPAADKIRWIQAFLVSLYHNNILHRRLVVDGVIEAIPESTRRPILNRFCRRLGVSNHADLAPVWHRMMDFWPVPEVATTETALGLRLTLFHRLVNAAATDITGEACGRRSSRASSAEAAPPVEIAATSRGLRPPAAPLSRARVEVEEPGFLTTADVRRIVNRASFLVQEHGVLLNVAFEIRPALLGAETQAQAIALIVAFCDDLAAQERAWGDEAFASLTLLERDPMGVVGRVVAHLALPTALGPADRDGGRAEAWAQEWARSVAPVDGKGAVQVEAAATDGPAALAFHWDKALALCAGLSEAAEAWDPATGKHRSLLKLLGVRPRQPAPISGRPLVEVSPLLTDAAVAEACRNRLDPLSAFDDGTWAEVTSGWERDEFRERQATRAEREAELARIWQRLGGDTLEARAAIEAVVHSWPSDPRARRRRWRGWWE